MGKNFRVILVIGKRKAGKSTFIKNVIHKNHKGGKLVFDINNEYGPSGGGVICPFPVFLERAKNTTNSLVIFEDATIFLSNKGDSEALKYLMVLARHRSNTIVLVFHSLQSMPSYILAQTDLVVLFKTGENMALIEKKLSKNVEIYEAFVEINRSDKDFVPKLINLRA